MKTPEQIAKEELERIGLDSVDDIDDWGHLERIVTLVIEADRAQRDPNPVLVYYRAAGVPDDWEQDLVHLAFMHTPKHIDHARKVLERLETLQARAESAGRDRSELVAWIEDQPDEFWERFAGHFLDDIEGEIS